MTALEQVLAWGDEPGQDRSVRLSRSRHGADVTMIQHRTRGEIAVVEGWGESREDAARVALARAQDTGIMVAITLEAAS